MEQKKINLEEFENLEKLQVSAGWNQSLMHKIELSKISKKPKFKKSTLIFSLAILFCLNLGFVSGMLLNQNSKETSNLAIDEANLDLLTNELLINLN